MINNFVKEALNSGAIIRCLDLPVEYSEGLGMCNPSIFVDGEKVWVNVRRVNYAFHNSITNFWNTAYGPTNYHHPDHDQHLRTENYVAVLDRDFKIDESTIRQVDYSAFYTEPIWSFVGEEDVRIVRWDDHLYLTGCRRDTTTDGESRMELTEVNDEGVEVNRYRIPTVKNKHTYCEKNWMPILDMPYHYVKWCNPLEIVKYDPHTDTTEQLMVKHYDLSAVNPDRELFDLRGSSQVVHVEGYYIALVHEVGLWRNRYGERLANYFSRFIVWDEDWNIVKLSPRFWYLGFNVEFGTGLAFKDNKFYIPFSVFDNAAFLMVVDKSFIFNFVGLESDNNSPVSTSLTQPTTSQEALLHNYINDFENPYKAYDLAMYYYKCNQFCAAHAFFLRSAELSVVDKRRYLKIGYDGYYMCQKCLEKLGDRGDKIIHQYPLLIQWDPNRYEAYYELSKLYYNGKDVLQDHNMGMGWAAGAKGREVTTVRGLDVDESTVADMIDLQYYICAYRCAKDYVAVEGFKRLLKTGCKKVREDILSLNLNL